ncbi:hypothetical protein D3C71_1450790 [compost metagenome]
MIVYREYQCAAILAQSNALQRILGAVRGGVGKLWMNTGITDHGSKHGQRQRFVVITLVFRQQRQRPHDSIAVRDRVEKTCCGRSAGQALDIAAVPFPTGGNEWKTAQLCLVDCRWGENPFFDSVAIIAREVVAQHHRMALERLGKQGVVVQAGCKARQLRFEVRLVAQRAVGQLLQCGEARGFIRFGEKNIKPDDSHLLAFEQFARQCRKFVSSPRPLANAAQALFIDIHNDDALVKCARHRDPQTRVVNDVVQPLKDLKIKNTGNVQDRKKQRNQGDRDAAPVALKQLR